MAVTFPMPMEDFFRDLPIQTLSFDLTEAMEYSETGAGEIITSDLGERLWKASVSMRPQYYAEAERIKARLNLFRSAGRSLLAHSLPLIRPANDPSGSKLGVAKPSIAAVSANNRDMRVKGLPVGYKLATGDFLSFTYGANPLRYAMHQISGEDQTANANGEVLIELTPFVQPGWAANALVQLIRPTFKAIVIPGSVSSGSSSARWTNGVKFDIIQTFR